MRKSMVPATVDACVIAAVLFLMPGCGSSVPSVRSVSPGNGAVGTNVKIAGSGFGKTQGNGKVRFGGEAEPGFIAWSDTLISVTVPQGLKPADGAACAKTAGDIAASIQEIHRSSITSSRRGIIFFRTL